MEHVLRAEYEEGAGPQDGEERVRIWHMVRGGGREAMCGRVLEQDAETRPSEAWGTADADPFCHTCGALFLREVP